MANFNNGKVLIFSLARSDLFRMRPLIDEMMRCRIDFDIWQYPASNTDDALALEESLRVAEKNHQVFRSAVNSSGKLGWVVDELCQLLSNNSYRGLLLFGDRSELLMPVLAGLRSQTPIIHIGGGHTTFGAIDDSVRDAVTVSAELHFVHNMRARESVDKIKKLGQTHTVGALDIDLVRRHNPISRKNFAHQYGLDPCRPIAFLTLHPETRETSEWNREMVTSVAHLLASRQMQVLWTSPNDDPGRDVVLESLQLILTGARCQHRSTVGAAGFLNCLSHADLVIGNSSGFVIEGSVYEADTVLTGSRQEGRDFHAKCRKMKSAQEIFVLEEALDDVVAIGARGDNPRPALDTTPYGSGDAARRICEVLTKW